jgi:hypothetical protein
MLFDDLTATMFLCCFGVVHCFDNVQKNRETKG